MNRVVILNGNHLCHNPRVIKEAAALAGAGHDVEVLGASLNAELVSRDQGLAVGQAFRFTPVVDLAAAGPRGGTTLRGRRWLAYRAKRWLGVESAHTLGYGMTELLAAARSRKADLYIAHSEPALWVAARLAGDGSRIGVDMEDWFSEDLLPGARQDRPTRLLRTLEARVLAAAVHLTCPSAAMSAALVEAYGCPGPAVVYNAFPWADRSRLDGASRDRPVRDQPSLHWFSQSIGPGRGLETLFAALRMMEPRAEVHLRGAVWPGYRDWLQGLVPQTWRDRVFIHGVVSNDELPSRIAEHDIGVSLDPAEPRSRDLTVTNKIMQYMLGGLAIIATATRGQSEIASQAPGAIRMCRPGDAAELAGQLRALIGDPVALAEARRASLAAARSRFNWEAQVPTLVTSVERALALPP